MKWQLNNDYMYSLQTLEVQRNADACQLHPSMAAGASKGPLRAMTFAVLIKAWTANHSWGFRHAT